MSAAFSIQPFQMGDWPLYRQLRLRALVDSPDAFGSTFALESALSDSDWERRLTAGVESNSDLPLLAIKDGIGVGVAWVKRAANAESTANLYQMWVVPEVRSLGVGSALVSAAVEWARQQGIQALMLGATCGNTAAMRLYLKHGFMPAGASEPLRPGSNLLSQTLVLQVKASLPG